MTAPRVPEDPQDGQDRHLDAGAYVLGLLDEADRVAFQAHLTGCARCTAEVAELGELEPLLAEFAASTGAFGGAHDGTFDGTFDGARGGTGSASSGEPDNGSDQAAAPVADPGTDPFAGPGPRLLDRLLEEVDVKRRRARTRRLVLALAASVLIVAGPAVTAAIVNADSHPTVQAAAVLHSATAPGGASATVGVTGKSWGSAITLKLGGVSGPRTCTLVAVPVQGQPQTVTTWQIPATGYVPPAGALQTAGGTGFHPSDISHFEVRDLASGQILVSVPAT